LEIVMIVALVSSQLRRSLGVAWLLLATPVASQADGFGSRTKEQIVPHLRSVDSRGFRVSTTAFVSAASPVEQNADRASIAGRVIGPDASGFPGVHVSATGAGLERSTITDIDGRFTLAGLLPGRYQVSVQLPGFQTISREVPLTSAGVVDLEFELQLDCLGRSSEPLFVDHGFTRALQLADAVIDVRISESVGLQRWDLRESCFIATEYVVSVGETAKWKRPDGTRPTSVRLLNIGPTAHYTPSEEYIALLIWQPGLARFQTLAGSSFMFPVRNGRVVWLRRDVPQLKDGMTVGAFLAALRSAASDSR
jgi:hypothetical protein